jgi:hypothetical protein
VQATLEQNAGSHRNAVNEGATHLLIIHEDRQGVGSGPHSLLHISIGGSAKIAPAVCYDHVPATAERSSAGILAKEPLEIWPPRTPRGVV